MCIETLKKKNTDNTTLSHRTFTYFKSLYCEIISKSGEGVIKDVCLSFKFQVFNERASHLFHNNAGCNVLIFCLHVIM